MLVKKTILATVAVVALGSSAVAVAAAPASDSFFSGNGSGFVVGVQGGYADQHWDDLFASGDTPSADVKDTGFAARGFVGYDVNKYFGVESGFTYLPKTTVNNLNGDIKSYAIDLLAKLTVPVTNVFSVYAKAGGSYLHSAVDIGEYASTNTHIGPAFGVGASYEVVPNLAIDLSWMRFSGQGRAADSKGQFQYQPNPDVVLLGVSYKFPVRYT